MPSKSTSKRRHFTAEQKAAIVRANGTDARSTRLPGQPTGKLVRATAGAPSPRASSPESVDLANSTPRSATTGWVESITLGDIEQTLSYDSFGAVDGSEYIYDGTDSLFTYALERDEFGRIIEQTETVDGGAAAVWTYEYDNRGRVSRAELGSAYVEYTYDNNGNRLSVTTAGGTDYATYDAQDRIEDYGGWTFVHGDAGEIIEKSHGPFDTREYEYDALGNLLTVTLPDATEISYEYDARGRVVARYVDAVFDKGWLWQDQLNPVAEVDEMGVVTARYVYGSRGHVPDYVITGGETYRLVTDYRGSVRAVVDDEGNLVQTIQYGPWGEVFSEWSSGFESSFGFAGGLWDSDTQLVRFGARLYDPMTGRWMMKDPILFDGGQANLYVYVENDSVNLTDPSGLTVYRCRGPSDDPRLGWVPVGPIWGGHHWIKTDAHEFGMGPCPNSDESGMGKPTCSTDSTGRSLTEGSICEAVPNVDEACVDAAYSPGYPLGPFNIFFNNCRDHANWVISSCAIGDVAGQDCRSFRCWISGLTLLWNPIFAWP